MMPLAHAGLSARVNGAIAIIRKPFARADTLREGREMPTMRRGLAPLPHLRNAGAFVVPAFARADRPWRERGTARECAGRPPLRNTIHPPNGKGPMRYDEIVHRMQTRATARPM